ncbi:alpha/beta hydrolase [Cumulibacter soli]|uniref:alpha/beta hydrolase n=1 Tax=Cumulibacter soli TaxID=2546344 RepID=UPI0010688136|nr:alpha/beta hydrolase [Cumulibacter soli]
MRALLRKAGDAVLRFEQSSFGGLSTGGIIAALLGLFASLSPSILPRPWVMQGIISGLVLTLFYPLGVLVEWIVRRIAGAIDFQYSISPGAKRVLSIGWFLLTAAVYLSAQAISLGWQRESAALVGAPEPGADYVLGSLLMTSLVFLVIMTIYRGIHWAVLRADTLGRRLLPAAVSRSLATLVVLVLAVVLVDRLVLVNIIQVAEQRDGSPPEGVSAPTSSLRSGGPGSNESWASLGTEGAQFVSRGPTAAEISEVTGEPAIEPIRAYAGLGDYDSDQSVDADLLSAVADDVVGELERTGAFDRAAILVYTTTGTGWVNEWHAAAFEYLEGGDTAIAAMQYSRFPSALALLTDTQTPQLAGQLLYSAVADKLDDLPEDSRPKLYLGGESLGAFGGQSTFSTPQAQLAGVDGAVWSGTPGFTPLHSALTAERMPGSTEVNPVIDNGRHFRFAARQAELVADQYGRPLGPWLEPRVLYLQHPSDPVVWWSMDLLFNSPDWIDEPPGADVTGQVSFTPIATLLQISADMAVATNVDSGHGHVYHEELVPAWAAVLGQDPTEDYSKVEMAVCAEIRPLDPALCDPAQIGD